MMAVDVLVELESQLSQLIANLKAMADLPSEEPGGGSRLDAARAAAERSLKLVEQQLGRSKEPQNK